MNLRLGVLLLTAAGAIVFALLTPPVAQDAGYHLFADQRKFFGVPSFWNVVSNLPFLLAGIYGLIVWRHARWAERSDQAPWLVVALASLLIGAGSSYYHAWPDNHTLFWDRLPMTLAFMGIFSAAISERIHARAGALLLAPFLLLGVLSVEVWRRGELTGVGDLRFYALVQFYPMVALPLMLWMYPARYTEGHWMWRMAVLYGSAKLLELADRAIYMATAQITGGHALKHVAGACALAMVFRMLQLRRPVGA